MASRHVGLAGALTLALAFGGVGQGRAAPVAEAQRAPLDLRRTTLVVRDIEASLAFYRDGLGLRVLYDNVIRTPRTARTDAEAERSLRLVLLRANDDYIGVLGLMQYAKPARTPRASKGAGGELHPGDMVLLFNTSDLQARFDRASGAPGARIDERPHPTTYPSYDGKGVIKVMFSALYDPDGNYVELNQVLDERLH